MGAATRWSGATRIAAMQRSRGGAGTLARSATAIEKPARALARRVLVLASASPRRADLLAQIGLEFTVAHPKVDESPPPRASAREAALAIARRKALAVERGDSGTWVLAADTLGVLDGRLLGKPRDAEDAVRMLLSLAGREHAVVTGVVVVAPGGYAFEDATETTVAFEPFDEARARAYVATGEPLGKAGAYAIQGLGGALVRDVRGSASNVVGLPLHVAVRLLRKATFPLPPHLA